MGKIGFAIIGLGARAELHARVIEAMEDCYLAAVYSRKIDRAREFISRHGGEAKPYEEIEYLLENPDVDIVVVTTPTEEHLKPAIMAMQSGRHVIVESPFDISIKRAMEMMSVSENEGVYLTTVLPYRFLKTTDYLRNAIQKGSFGRLLKLQAYINLHVTEAYFKASLWKSRKALSGRGVLSQIVNTLDQILYIAGDAFDISCNISSRGELGLDIEDSVTVEMNMDCGASFSIKAMLSPSIDDDSYIELIGTKGRARISGDRILSMDFEEKEICENYESSSSKLIDFECTVKQYRNFISSISSGIDPVVTPYEAIRAIAHIEAMCESSKNGHSVSVKSFLPLAP